MSRNTKAMSDEIKIDRGEIILYRAPDGQTSLTVRLQNETIWLDAHQMGMLFDRDRSVILRDIRNIYSSRELAPEATCAKIAQVANDKN